MACIVQVPVKCTNKLCDYGVTKTRYVSRGYDAPVLTEKLVCPQCGFKTLVESIGGMLSEVIGGQIVAHTNGYWIDVAVKERKEIDRLRGIIESAPHDTYCGQGLSGGECTCWKADVVIREL